MWRLAVALVSFGLAAQPVPPENWSDEEKEDFLRNAEMISVKAIRGGVTATQRVMLKRNGITHDAHVQAVDIRGSAVDSMINLEQGFTDSYRYNLAAHALDRMLGIGRIPATVEREFRSKRASYTWWIDDRLMDERERQAKNVRPPDPTAWNRQVFLMKVFDQLIDNVDRNMGNVIIDKQWHLWMIDHTRAFRTRSELREAGDLTRCDRVLLERLRALDMKQVKARLERWIEADRLEAVGARRDLIVKHFDGLVASKGEKAVLYDFLK